MYSQTIKIMNPNNTRTAAHCASQLNQLDKWLEEYITIHRELLNTTGIRCNAVYAAYASSFTFPVGLKTFGLHIKKMGVDRLKKGVWQYYVLFV